MEKKFVRYEASMPNGRGLHPGVFALANGLAKDGRLSAQDWTSWRSANDHYNAAYAGPSTVVGAAPAGAVRSLPGPDEPPGVRQVNAEWWS